MDKNLVRRLLPLTVIVSLLSATSVQAAYLKCGALGEHEDIYLTLNETGFRDYYLNCIYGDFTAGMSACSPAEGIGLSTGEELVNAGIDDKILEEHVGGVTEFSTTPITLEFRGGFSTPEQGYLEGWSFEVNRITGDGTLHMVDGDGSNPDLTYHCATREPIF